MADSKKICETSETKEVKSFLSNQFNLYDIPEKIKSDKGGIYFDRIQRILQIPKYKYNTAHPECISETEQLKEQYKQWKT